MKEARYSDQTIAEATGKGWSDWQKLLDDAGAAALSHKEIAAKLKTEHGVPGWWSQMLAVEYERAIGRRVIGQTCTGEFSAAATRTLPVDKDAAITAWRAAVAGMDAFDGVPFAGPPRESSTEKWRYWRVDLADGTKVTAMGSDKTPGKAGLAINHDKLADAEAVARWKAFWGPFVKGVGG
ncbi:DUF4287 domain-containing protein [Sphingomonas sp. LaA6.9]|uniref:DUF4287 domain-containing protein n=1 Tax=Sphingomonas sp. LaA6.9 TaxID=2919914 RepID=UPI001F4FAF1C|nr:DUF4287 domain-containing protein [Sphingomonas sp. LaA6.9]MCJ8159278.1 DUF4287 domain-containing protein [Sphingomonas sp. LaA6.9]